MTDTIKSNPFFEPLITLVVPALILMKLSDPERLGAIPALLLALAFPLVWGMRDLIRSRKLNLFAVLGLVSVGLTGGIGLLQLDNQWLAVKEAAIPGVIGLAVIVSGHTRYSADSRPAVEPEADRHSAHPAATFDERHDPDLRNTPANGHLVARWHFLLLGCHELPARHLDRHQPGRQPGLQRRTRADDVAELPGDRYTVDVDDDGRALLPCPNDPLACRPKIHGDIQPAR